jgi:sulfate adenylyltransferase
MSTNPFDHQKSASELRPGFCVFFTGLSGAGKTTIAAMLNAELLRISARKTTLLDGDAVRLHLSSELGFSRKDRDLNIMRIAYVAGEVVKHGGIAIASAIAPYDTARKLARTIVEKQGIFYLVHVSTPLDVCESRDVKGLYALARTGSLPQFTGVSDPYEEPADAELVINTDHVSAIQARSIIIARLRNDGLLTALSQEMTVRFLPNRF